MQLDPLDARILRLLREDARLSFRDIAAKVGSSVPTVSARVGALEDLGVIRGYRAELALGAEGGTMAHVHVQATPAEAGRILDALAAAPGVEDVALLSGGHLAARVRLQPPERTTRHLHEAIAALPGVVAYDVREVISTRSALQADDVPDRLDVRCHQCGGPIHGAPVRKAFGGRAHAFCCRQCLADFAERYERLGAKAKRRR